MRPQTVTKGSRAEIMDALDRAGRTHAKPGPAAHAGRYRSALIQVGRGARAVEVDGVLYKVGEE
jgi:hypothetical protein